MSLNAIKFRLRSTAAGIIQRNWCKAYAKIKATRIKYGIMFEAARDIQAIVRGNLTRKNFNERLHAVIKLQQVFRKCDKEKFSLRKRNAWLLRRCVPGGSDECPVTLQTIQTPVLNICDGKLYEKSSLLRLMQTETPRCPTTRRPLEWCPVQKISQRFQNLQDRILKLEKNLCAADWFAIGTNFSYESNDELKCIHCKYKAQSYVQNRYQACRAHLRDKHGIEGLYCRP